MKPRYIFFLVIFIVIGMLIGALLIPKKDSKMEAMATKPHEEWIMVCHSTKTTDSGRFVKDKNGIWRKID